MIQETCRYLDYLVLREVGTVDTVETEQEISDTDDIAEEGKRY